LNNTKIRPTTQIFNLQIQSVSFFLASKVQAVLAWICLLSLAKAMTQTYKMALFCYAFPKLISLYLPNFWYCNYQVKFHRKANDSYLNRVILIWSVDWLAKDFPFIFNIALVKTSSKRPTFQLFLSIERKSEKKPLKMVTNRFQQKFVWPNNGKPIVQDNRNDCRVLKHFSVTFLYTGKCIYRYLL
jgi:hypothetical protein